MFTAVFSCPFASPVLAAALLLGLGGAAQAAPEPVAAAVALLETPLDVAGDLIGGAGLAAATGVALAGDGLALVDTHSPARALLRGVPSRAVRGTAFGIAWSASRALELLRGEDIERLPEPAAAYLEVDPFAGRLDQLATGFEAVLLAVRDALGGPSLALLRGVGATQSADELERRRSEDRIATLGPDPLPRTPLPDGS